ncbi:65_t:CDS:2, partial [Funneliformis mosseae]
MRRNCTSRDERISVEPSSIRIHRLGGDTFKNSQESVTSSSRTWISMIETIRNREQLRMPYTRWSFDM